MSTFYTPEEIAKHNEANDLWMVYEDGVYDITKFYHEHPGGEEVLLDVAGKDGTTCFDQIGHSFDAITLRETYKIGTTVRPFPTTPTQNGTEPASSEGAQDTTIKNGDPTFLPGAENTTMDDIWKYESSTYESSPWLPVYFAAGVAIYAFIFYYIWYM